MRVGGWRGAGVLHIRLGGQASLGRWYLIQGLNESWWCTGSILGWGKQVWWPPGGTGLARLPVFEEPKKAGVSGAGERAAGSEVDRAQATPPLEFTTSSSRSKGKVSSRGAPQSGLYF